MATEKIARQGLTVRHVGVVVTMALTLLTAVALCLRQQAYVTGQYRNTSAFRHHKSRYTSRSFIWASASALPQWQNCSTSSTLKQYAL